MLPLKLNDNIKDRLKYHASNRHGIPHIIMYTNCFKSCRYFCFVINILSKQTYSKCMWLKCGWVCCYEISEHTINIIHLYIFDRSLECEIILLNTIMIVVKFVLVKIIYPNFMSRSPFLFHHCNWENYHKIMSIDQYNALYANVTRVILKHRKMAIWWEMSRTVPSPLRTCEDGILWNVRHLGKNIFRYYLKGQTYKPIRPVGKVTDTHICHIHASKNNDRMVREAFLTHCSMAVIYGVIYSGKSWFRQWLVTKAPSHYLNQCWLIVSWKLGNKLHWILNQCIKVSFKT